MRDPGEMGILRACLEYLALRRIPAWRFNSGGVRLPKGPGKASGFYRFSTCQGLADINGVLPGSGRWLAVEVKRPGKKLRANQAQFLDCIRQAGGLALCVRSLDDLVQALHMEGI